MLALWARGTQISTWAGTSNGNQYLVDESGIVSCATCYRKCMCILPMEMRSVQECVHTYDKPVQLCGTIKLYDCMMHDCVIQVKVHVTPILHVIIV